MGTAALGFIGIEAQEIDGLAHFRHGIGDRLAGLAHEEADQRRHGRLDPVGATAQDRGALPRRCGGPDRRNRLGVVKGQRHGGGILRDDCSHDVARIGWIADRRALAAEDLAADHGRRAPAPARFADQRRGEGGQCLLAGEIEPERILPPVIEGARRANRRMRRADRFERGCLLDRIGDQRLDRHRRIRDPVDERGVGAVLQQAAHQIGEQRLVRADWCVDAAGPVQPVRPDHILIERLAHAVQALELILPGVEIRAGQLHDGRERQRVVGRELREDRVGRGQQPLGAGDVGHIGVDLARIDGEVLQPTLLCPLDLAVPIGALDEAHHQPVPAASAEVDQPVDHEGAALAIGLDDEADAVPALKLRIEAERLQQVERELEPVRLLGVDIDADIIAPREQGEALEARQKLARHALDLRAGIARMQRRELDRDARPFIDAAPARRFADRVDRLLIGRKIARRIGLGHRRFAEHVIGIAEALRLQTPGVRQRLADILAGDELLAHQAHGDLDALADDAFAAARDQPRQRGREAGFAGGAGELAGDDEAPGRGIDEERGALPDMSAPVAGRDLVADQRVARRAVGDAQQRLGEAHQRHAFLGRERIFPDEAFDTAAAGLGAQPLDEPPRDRRGIGPDGGRQRRVADQERQAVGLGEARGCGDPRPQRALRTNRAGQGEERPIRFSGISGIAGAAFRFGNGGHQPLLGEPVG